MQKLFAFILSLSISNLLSATEIMNQSGLKRSVISAVVDGGWDVAHADFKNKRWVNTSELNGYKDYDDDRNGYRDDIYGFNFIDDNSILFNREIFSDADQNLYYKGLQALDILVKIQAGIPVSPDEQWLLQQNKDYLQDYVLPIMNELHGTHVAGIMANNNNSIEILGMKILGENAQYLAYTYDIPDGHDGIVLNTIMFLIYKHLTLQAYEIDDYEKLVDAILADLRKSYQNELRNFLAEIGTYINNQGVRVANNSWGEEEGSLLEAIKKQYPGLSKDKKAIEKLINGYAQIVESVYPALFINAPNTLFVIAAGNSALNNDEHVSMPTNVHAPNKISVASLNTDGTKLATYSNFGFERVDIAAPGENIESSAPYDRKVRLSGTSMAAPNVSNVASQILQEHSNLKPCQLKQILLDSASERDFLREKVASEGVLDQTQALRAAKNPYYARLNCSEPQEQFYSSQGIYLKLGTLEKEADVIDSTIIDTIHDCGIEDKKLAKEVKELIEVINRINY